MMIFDKAERYEKGKRNILSVDGGGMRGIIAVAMLAHLEDETGIPAYEMFDMVAGTSTGAIIAAGLAMKLTARTLLDQIYKQDLPQAFGSPLSSNLRFVLSGFRYRYTFEPFARTLQKYTKDLLIRDIDTMIVLFTIKDIRTGNTYYVVNKGEGAETFGHWPLGGVTAASGAAPIYFPPVLGNFIDGGVGVEGNPCLAAATEAMEYIGESEGFTDGNVTLVALGNGYPPHIYPDKAAARFNILDWVRYMILETIDDIALQQALSTRAIYARRERIDFRRYNPLLTHDGLAEIGVDSGSIDPQTLTLDTTDPAALDLMERIGRAYADGIEWQQPNVMPWDTKGGRQQPPIDTRANWDQYPS